MRTSLIIFQMMRVISSPSISTMGFFTVIATIVLSCEKRWGKSINPLRTLRFRGSGPCLNPCLLAKLQGAEEIGYFVRRRFRRVRAVDGVLLQVDGEILADRPRLGVSRIGRAPKLSPSGNGAPLLKDHGHAWARRHIVRQAAEKRLSLVHGVEALGLFPGEPELFHGDDLKTVLFDPCQYLSCHVSAYCVWFNDRKRLFH